MFSWDDSLFYSIAARTLENLAIREETEERALSSEGKGTTDDFALSLQLIRLKFDMCDMETYDKYSWALDSEHYMEVHGSLLETRNQAAELLGKTERLF